MKRPLRLILVLLVIALFILAFHGPGFLAPPGKVPWQTDFTAAQAAAKSTGKPLFLYFTASWCGPCQSLKSSLWPDAEVANALKPYTPVELDVDQPQTQLLAQQLHLGDGIPTFVLLDTQGNVVRTITGVDADDPKGFFLRWLRGEPMASQ